MIANSLLLDTTCIVHWVVLFYYMNLGEKPLYYVSVWQIYLYYAVPITALSFFAAFFWSCLLEISTAKLEKMFFDVLIGQRKSRVVDAKKNEAEHENGGKSQSWDLEKTKV